LVAPLAEEVLFRAYLFRQLYRRARLGFWISALIPSLVFAAAHLYQSDDPSKLLGIELITGSGSVLCCWLFVRWRDNVWPIVGLHSLMNLWWAVFAIDDSALGGWLANAARLATVALAIALTLYNDRRWKPAGARVDRGDGVTVAECGG
jgi:membrane protease YdiL (CAAX protease family)